MSQRDTNFHSQFGQFSGRKEKKKKRQSSLKISQNSYWRLLRQPGWLTEFFMFEPVGLYFAGIAFAIWGNNHKYTKVTF